MLLSHAHPGEADFHFDFCSIGSACEGFEDFSIFGFGRHLPGSRGGADGLQEIECLAANLISLPAEDGLHGRIAETDDPFQIDEQDPVG